MRGIHGNSRALLLKLMGACPPAAPLASHLGSRAATAAANPHVRSQRCPTCPSVLPMAKDGPAPTSLGDLRLLPAAGDGPTRPEQLQLVQSAPQVTPAPAPCSAPRVTPAPAPCSAPQVTPAPAPCSAPQVTPAPAPCSAPQVTPAPAPCSAPQVTPAPAPCSAPQVTPAPAPCSAPRVTPAPAPCSAPRVTPAPAPCSAPQVTPAPAPCSGSSHRAQGQAPTSVQTVSTREIVPSPATTTSPDTRIPPAHPDREAFPYRSQSSPWSCGTHCHMTEETTGRNDMQSSALPWSHPQPAIPPHRQPQQNPLSHQPASPTARRPHEVTGQVRLSLLQKAPGLSSRWFYFVTKTGLFCPQTWHCRVCTSQKEATEGASCVFHTPEQYNDAEITL
uniref:Uncharacterized protein n=1 Tax=Chelydra serpentina TaxID=8475 RepID=A0A8C3SG50_CHESE